MKPEMIIEENGEIKLCYSWGGYVIRKDNEYWQVLIDRLIDEIWVQ